MRRGLSEPRGRGEALVAASNRPDDGVWGHGWAVAGLVSDQSREENSALSVRTLRATFYRVGKFQRRKHHSERKIRIPSFIFPRFLSKYSDKNKNKINLKKKVQLYSNPINPVS